MTLINYDFVLKFGTQGSGNGELDYPTDVATDSSGNIYVVDNGNDRIQKFNSLGVYVSQFGETGAGNGQFNGPWGIAIDASGNIYVSDEGNNRVQKFTSAGVYAAQWASADPYGIACDPSGNVIVSSNSARTVIKYTSSGSVLWTSAYGYRCYGIDCDASGDVYLIDYYGFDVSGTNYYIGKLDADDGSLLAYFGTYDDGGELYFMSPAGLSITSGGNVCVSEEDERGAQIQEITPGGVFVCASCWSGSVNDPTSVAPDNLDGYTWRPQGIHSDKSGYLYIADSDNYRVQKLKRNTYVLKN